ncbi:phospholipase C, phosphocholine-specific [Massilia sp. W12]|uniref:phosphocholine-specific phospholipase C n=1 Tax=Massilia sp. W12 TaxID=3126507 RepID=UPI0030D00B09
MQDNKTSGRRGFLAGAGALAASNLFPDLIKQALAIPAHHQSGTLADIGHVVIFMQENRAFDHYFGCLPGVRGFHDPRAIRLPGGAPVWYQPDGKGGHVLPFHFDAKNTSALSLGTNHSWKGNQTEWQGWDAWVKRKSAQAMGYFNREDIPFYYALADAFTICDEYHCSIFGATDPNRLYSLSGTCQNMLGFPGGLYNINAAGYYNNDPAKDNISAEITKAAPNWQTYAEVLEANQVSWKVYQEWDNYGDNYLAYFKQFRINPDGSRLSSDSPLYQKGRQLAPGSNEANSVGTRADWLVAQFANDVKNNALPQVSWICAPNDYTEHSPNSPNAGENLTARLLAALVANPAVWSKTVFLLSYDENDGFFDHMPSHLAPLHAEMGKTTLPHVGQWEAINGVPTGLGPRVPMLIISPWTRGGRVCSQLMDHTSKLRFLEEWLVQGLGKKREDVTCRLISPWRRAVLGDMRAAFDFKNPNQVWPDSVPKNTSWSLVTGKPYPQPPKLQSLPVQEVASNGPRGYCPLQYDFSADFVRTGRQLGLILHNSGRDGGAFIVYSRQRSDGPWYYALEAGRSLAQENWNCSGDAYHLWVHAAGGFLRECSGSLQHNLLLEVWARHVPGANQVALTFANQGGQALQADLIDMAYGAPGQKLQLAAGERRTVYLPAHASFGWYDWKVLCAADGAYLRRFAGHIENGAFSRTDPALARRLEEPGLMLTTPSVQQGASISIGYQSPAAQLHSKNWVGIYAKGQQPGAAGSKLWAYAPQGFGAVQFNSASLARGEYSAWYLYADGYTALCAPQSFSVL